MKRSGKQTGGRPALVWLAEIAGCGEEKGSCAAYLKKRWREAGKDLPRRSVC